MLSLDKKLKSERWNEYFDDATVHLLVHQDVFCDTIYKVMIRLREIVASPNTKKSMKNPF